MNRIRKEKLYYEKERKSKTMNRIRKEKLYYEQEKEM